MRDYLKGKYAELIARMEDQKDLSGDDEKLLHDAIKDWKQNGAI
jgi:F-type H+-transporting ATPase subunit alpha